MFILEFLKCSKQSWKITATLAKDCLPRDAWFLNLRLNVDAREEVS